ncbi:MAG TPA: ATP-binding cassette domain-containing protein [Micromonosporaceae bacterium]|jgi:ABC-2 type transport system ATP-binding protein
MPHAIEVRELRKCYGRTTAVDGLSFTVHSGRVTGFVGPNGAGKSTTMRIILGLDRPERGQALIGGTPYRALRNPLRQVGALLDANAVHPGRSGRNHLLWLARSNGLPTARVDEVIEQVGLGSAGRRRAGGYSLGMLQRLGIAAALLGNPGVLILDEPVNGLDPEGVRWIRGRLRSLAEQGRAVLVSSHLMAELEDTADHLVVIGRGRLLADTPVAQLIASASSARLTLRTTHRAQAMAALARAGAVVAATGGDTLTIDGIPAERVTSVLAEQAVPFSELTAHRASLEEAYLELTRAATDYRAQEVR